MITTTETTPTAPGWHPSYQECVDTAACPVCGAPAGIWCAGSGPADADADIHIGRIRLYGAEYPEGAAP